MESKLILLNLGSSNVFISQKMRFLMCTFLYKNMVPMLHTSHVSIWTLVSFG